VLRKEVIVDTNALLLPVELGVDIFGELERLGYLHIIVPKMVLNELDQIKQRPGLKGKERMAAKVGYALIRKYTEPSEQERRSLRCMVSIEEFEEEGVQDTDELIVALALKRKAAVLTNDEELRSKLSRSGIVTVYLRGRNRLEERD
jgi:rRNA-processing protein FCF1